MSREWEPGDAAIAEVLGMAIRGIIDTDGRFYTTDQRVKGISSSKFAPEQLRPLVMIDPEDRGAVERFREIASRLAEWVGYDADPSAYTDAMQAALREFADPKPPKPEWRDGDVIQHALRKYTAQRYNRKWHTTTSSGRDWADDDYVTRGVEAGDFVVLRQQAADEVTS